jgi:hypothetical protein
MTATTLFQAALSLPAPWQVTDVRFEAEAQELHLALDFPPGREHRLHARHQPAAARHGPLLPSRLAGQYPLSDGQHREQRADPASV